MSRKQQQGAKRSPQLRLKIEDLNERGEGVAYYNKLKLNIRKALPGETVLVRYDPRRPRKDRLQLLRILEPSPLRVQPPCPYFEECGGCHLQHLQYTRQLEVKRRNIQRLLLAYPALRGIRVETVEGMPEPTFYRNKTQMPFVEQGGEVVYGLFRKGTHEVIPVDTCLVESKDANRALQIVRDWARKYRIPAYDERSGQGVLRHVVIRKGMFTGQLMVVVVSNLSELPHWKELVSVLKMEMRNLKSIVLNVNSARTNLILGPRNLVLWGDPFIEERLGPRRFKIFPETFFQTNSVQAVKMLELIRKQVPLNKSVRLLDLFSGVGTMGLYFADQVKEVFGLEVQEAAVQAAVDNAAFNEITNARFAAADLNGRLAPYLSEGFRPEVVLVNPPRKGLSETLIEEIAELTPEYLVYISCNPKTLVKNLARFFELGFTGDAIYPFDMFPHTMHVESVIILRKKTGRKETGKKE